MQTHLLRARTSAPRPVCSVQLARTCRHLLYADIVAELILVVSGMASERNTFQLAQDPRIVPDESSTVLDDPMGNRIEISDFARPELLKDLSKALDEAHLLLAREVVRLPEFNEDLVI